MMIRVFHAVSHLLVNFCFIICKIFELHILLIDLLITDSSNLSTLQCLSYSFIHVFI